MGMVKAYIKELVDLFKRAETEIPNFLPKRIILLISIL